MTPAALPSSGVGDSSEGATGALDARAALAELVDKYRLLDALGSGEPGRTRERRDAMRVIAARFPGALREWDEAPVGEIARRRRVAEMAWRRVSDAGDAGLGGGPALVGDELAHRGDELAHIGDELGLVGDELAFLRYGLDVHLCLRRALDVKRWLAGRVLGDELVREAAARFGIDRDELTAIAEPPSGRLSEEVYRAVARAHDIAPAALKAALFPHAAPSTAAPEPSTAAPAPSTAALEPSTGALAPIPAAPSPIPGAPALATDGEP